MYKYSCRGRKEGKGKTTRPMCFDSTSVLERGKAIYRPATFFRPRGGEREREIKDLHPLLERLVVGEKGRRDVIGDRSEERSSGSLYLSSVRSFRVIESIIFNKGRAFKTGGKSRVLR